MRSRRLPRCGGCGLPNSLCVCPELPVIRVRPRVIVVVSRSEAIRTTNTGRLAARMLEGSSLVVSGAPGLPALPASPSGAVAVLFPFEGTRPLQQGDPIPEVLIVPDGSWSQARRMAIKLVRGLGAAAVALPAGGDGLQAMRKPPGGALLCTCEAIARALSILEGSRVEQQMMPALRRFIERSKLVRRGGGR